MIAAAVEHALPVVSALVIPLRQLEVLHARARLDRRDPLPLRIEVGDRPAAGRTVIRAHPHREAIRALFAPWLGVAHQLHIDPEAVEPLVGEDDRKHPCELFRGQRVVAEHEVDACLAGSPPAQARAESDHAGHLEELGVTVRECRDVGHCVQRPPSGVHQEIAVLFRPLIEVHQGDRVNKLTQHLRLEARPRLTSENEDERGGNEDDEQMKERPLRHGSPPFFPIANYL